MQFITFSEEEEEKEEEKEQPALQADQETTPQRYDIALYAPNDNEYYDPVSDECYYIKNCAESYDDGECLMCNAYYLDYDGQCRDSGDEHLMYSYDYGYEYFCDMNYGWSYKEDKCIECRKNCFSCKFDENGEEKSCSSFNGKYENDKFVKGCSVDNCKTCIHVNINEKNGEVIDYDYCSECNKGYSVDYYGECGICEDGYVRVNDKCYPEIEGCYTYSDDGSKCLGCGRYYYYDGKKCVFDKNCRYSNAEGKCSECKEKYYVNDEGICKRCKDENCLECDHTGEYCSVCIDDTNTNNYY